MLDTANHSVQVSSTRPPANQAPSSQGLFEPQQRWMFDSQSCAFLFGPCLGIGSGVSRKMSQRAVGASDPRSFAAPSPAPPRPAPSTPLGRGCPRPSAKRRASPARAGSSAPLVEPPGSLKGTLLATSLRSVQGGLQRRRPEAPRRHHWPKGLCPTQCQRPGFAAPYPPLPLTSFWVWRFGLVTGCLSLESKVRAILDLKRENSDGLYANM